jgi:hypothetical protein
MDGDHLQARPVFEESLEIRRRLGEPRGIAITAGNLAQVTLAAGELEVTEALLDEVLEHAGAIGYQAVVADARAVRALLELHRGEVENAASELVEATGAMAGEADPESGANMLAAGAVLASIKAEPLQAATLWAATDRVLEQLGRVETPAARRLRLKWLPVARSAAPDGTWENSWSRGHVLSLDAALALISHSSG